MENDDVNILTKDAALQELDQLQEAERHRHRAGLAGTRELRWLAGVCLLLLLPVFASPFVLSAYHALLICYYAAIVGFVVAGWGIWRSFRDRRTQRYIFRAAALVWACFFLIFLLVYGNCLLSPRLEKPWKITDRFSGSMRKK